MIKYFFIIIFILLQLQAKTFIYYEELQKMSLKEYMSYKFDSNDSIESILKKKDKFKPLEKTSFGFDKKIIWTQIQIENPTNKKQNITLKNPNNFLDFMNIYIYQNNKLVQSYKKGFLQQEEHYSFFNRHNAIDLELPANSSISIFTKIETQRNLNVVWQIFSNKKYLKTIIMEVVIGVLFATFLFTASSYSFAIYLNTKMKVFSYYSIMMISILMLNYFEKGFWVWITPNIYPPTFISLLQFFATITPITVILFTQNFFETKNKFKTFHKILNTLASIFMILMLLYMIFTYFDNHLRFFLMPILLIVVFILFTTLISLASLAIKRGVDGAIFYLIGEGIYFILVGSRLFFKLIGEEDSLSALSVSSIGISFEIVFFSIALGVKLKRIKEELQKSKKLIEIKSREKTIATTIGNISHQWKAPLTQVGVLLTKLEFNLEQYPNSKAIETIHQVNYLVKYMSDITEEYQNLYKNGDKKRIFVKESINKSLLLLKEKIKEANISIEVMANKSISIESYQNALKQVLIIIIDNAISICKIRKVKNPKIIIVIEKIDKVVSIEINDNGGGVKIKPIEQIFEEGISQKGENGVGIGLYLAKQLTLNVLNGELIVENKKDGACFKIELNS